MNEFLQALARALEANEIKPADSLKALPQWDSLAVLSIIAMLDANYSVNLQAAELAQVDSAESLWNLVQSRKPA
ncbi:MAG TPA: acyl carrier protein [Verrucomicrobiae bacterium]|nr:acyl carrier protein [Verrucomicrobiae bacterium]